MALIGVCRKVADLADRVAAAHQHARRCCPMRSRDTVIKTDKSWSCCVTSNLGPETITTTMGGMLRMSWRYAPCASVCTTRLV